MSDFHEPAGPGAGTSGRGYWAGHEGYADDGHRQDANRDGGYPDEAHYDEGHYDEAHYDEGHYDDGHYDDGHYDDGHYDEARYHDEHYDDDHLDDGEHYGDHPGGVGQWPVVDGTGAPSYRAGRRRGRTGRRPRPLLTALVGLVILAVLVVGGGLIYAEQQINPGGRRGPVVAVVIPKGASTTQIGSDLASAGVIHNGTLFAYYVRLHGDGPLYPGTYNLPRNSPYSTAISALKAGPKIVTDNLVIPEGFTLRQIAAAVGGLPGMGLSAAEFMQVAESGSVRSPYEPAGSNNLEGLLFPATYQVSQGETVTEILEQMVGAFDDRANQIGLSAAAAKLGYTPYQVVTVASIVERESKLDSDRGPVASAIYNRLRIGMKLGADSTQTYYLRLTNPTLQPTVAQLDQPGPYNTRTNTGLPPTPIANPGLASLEAAAAPPTTTYLYFVETNPDGKLSFASTNAGFEQLQQQCRTAGLC